MIEIKKKEYPSVRWLFKNAKSIYAHIIFLTLCAISVSYISVRFALVSKELLDCATNASASHMLKDKIVKLVILVVIQLVLQTGYTLLLLRTEVVFKQGLQRKVYSKLLGKKWSSLSEFHSGEILNRLNGDVGIVTTNILQIVPNVFAFVSRIVLSFSALYVLDSDFALIFLVVGPFVMIVARIYSKKIKPLHKQAQSCMGKTHSFILESLRNILVVKSYGAEKSMTKKVAGLQKNTFKVIMKRGYLSIIANILFYISLTIGYYFAVGWCAYKISLDIMTVGTFTAVIQLVGQIQTPFKELASVIPQFFATTASAERIMEVENLPDEEKRYDNINANDVYNSMNSICVKDISFAYGDEQIFKNASVTIPKNSLTAIAGISGIGKSTLLKLILGIIEPSVGSVSVECQNGESYIADASLRKLFAYVPQGNMLLSGTIRENIAFVCDGVSDEDIEEAARIACIYDVIAELPEGFGTRLGEGGSGLSEGQIQRLAVARAICSKAPILLLDEATSALDEETEEKMLSNIKALNDRTCIIISHKECALEISDLTLTISDGIINSKTK
ncbi:MAG: ABC transporter ATP-binding protein [Clostridia bacterium]|nr:ABC transporter ATP-binding protein [Clostridia bacterium]